MAQKISIAAVFNHISRNASTLVISEVSEQSVEPVDGEYDELW
jgi:hypothetical protein